MAHEQDRQDDLTAFEAALAALKPRGNAINRDRLMFLAGQASGSSTQPRRWGWPAAFGAMTTVAASLLTALMVRPPQVVERIVDRVVEVPAAPLDATFAGMNRYDRRATGNGALPAAPRRWIEQPSSWTAFLFAPTEDYPAVLLSPAKASNYMRLREIAFTRGLDGWPTPGGVEVAGASMPSRSRPSSQRELLDELLQKPDVSHPQRSQVSPESTIYPGARS